MKKLILLALLPLGLFGQQTQMGTVYQNVFTSTQTLGASNPIRNIGQTYHLMAASLTDAPTKTCVSVIGLRLELQASYDNSAYFTIGQPMNAIVPNFVAVTWAYGAYPFVRVNYIAGTSANCVLTVNYSGSTTGSKVNPVYDSGIKNGFVTGLNFTTVGAGTLALNTCLFNTTRFLTIYGFYMNNTSGGTLTGITLNIQDSAGSPVIIDTMNIGSLGALASVSMKAETVPLLGLNQSATLLNATFPLNVSVTASGAGLTGWILARCE